MSFRQRLRLWRRRWCVRRGHPMADWSPICTYEKGPDRIGAFGELIEGPEIITRQWRCARHDQDPNWRACAPVQCPPVERTTL